MKKIILSLAVVATLGACSNIGEPSNAAPGAREVVIGNTSYEGVDGNDPRFLVLLAAALGALALL